MEHFQASDIRGLVKLFNVKDEDSDDERDNKISKTPHSQQKIRITECSNEQNKVVQNSNYYKKLEKSKDIWCYDEVLDEDYDEDQNKDKPPYEMIYQQDVTPDDIYLQLNGKGPGSISCECLLVKIKLDGTSSIDEINLKISEDSLICKTKKYYLDLCFPKLVDLEKCTAKWNQLNKLLEVKLSIQCV
ncbi:hypothetical protein TNIN_280101 [Trichonephila inaurata madagascariensis]|uniref:PIH1D1/2/3 CS-like domain-containing protein n=1 Tax=Trichonephila inaurata madagascariensis TaxID=2747483 RepID=A0A8X6XD98_9ARAC|nr:hypothetical protein TNIN_280101 [Trichonephila inaurata madagascariensis]